VVLASDKLVADLAVVDPGEEEWVYIRHYVEDRQVAVLFYPAITSMNEMPIVSITDGILMHTQIPTNWLVQL